jgi:Polysaccharide lyase
MPIRPAVLAVSCLLGLSVAATTPSVPGASAGGPGGPETRHSASVEDHAECRGDRPLSARGRSRLRRCQRDRQPRLIEARLAARTPSTSIEAETMSVSPRAAGSVRRFDWTAKAERSTAQEWLGVTAQSLDRVSRVTSPRAAGAYAYKLTLKDGDRGYVLNPNGTISDGPYGERTELGQGNQALPDGPARLFNENDDKWIAWQVYVPNDFPVELTSSPVNSWQIVWQLKQVGGFGTPAISMEIKDGKWWLQTTDSTADGFNNSTKWTSRSNSVIRNRWVKFTMRVKFSLDRTAGFVELYGDLDGAGMKTLLPRLYGPTMKASAVPAKSHARLGIYRNPSITGDAAIYYDGYTVAPTRKAAERSAGVG